MSAKFFKNMQKRSKNFKSVACKLSIGKKNSFVSPVITIMRFLPVISVSKKMKETNIPKNFLLFSTSLQFAKRVKIQNF